jgi:hypothetical protein
MRFDNWMKRLVAVAIVVTGLSPAIPAVTAQEPSPLLLILDKSAIDYGDETHLIPEQAANSSVANIGLRDQLPFFGARRGESFKLPGGIGASAGWFALRSVPPSWDSQEGLNDGLENFYVAGAGLGSPDDSGNRVSLLGSVPEVVALPSTGIGLLVGRRVCAVVYAGEIEAGATTDLGGANLGVVAFSVTSADAAGADWASVTVQILDARETCSGALGAFSEAPSAQ